MILALLSCGRAAWTVEGALSPTLARLDQDHDGRVTATEYARVVFPPGPFPDADGDGALSIDELRASMLATDPVTFYTAPATSARRDPAVARHAGVHGTLAWRVLESLRLEAEAAGGPGPTPDEVEEAARLGDLDSPAVRTLLAGMEADAARAGRRFPASLRAPSSR
jgi:hypothetical protein